MSAVHNSFVGIEHLTDHELNEIRSKCERRAEAEKVHGQDREKHQEKGAARRRPRYRMKGATDHTRNVRRQALSKNIESIVKLEEYDERELSRLHRASHKIGWFVGTIHFVIPQVALVVLWTGWNAYGPARFDPYPFNLLSAFFCPRSRAADLLRPDPA